MAETILCPVCGEANPADMEFCQNCQSRLHPLTGPLRGENSPIQPGELPTKKVTSELEPILPQWLREARQQARATAAEEASDAAQAERDTPQTSGPDLLAGLASQSTDDEDETPEWVAHITGTPAKKKKIVPEGSQVKWVELGHGDEAQDSLLGEESGAALGGRIAEAAPEKDELSEWFKQASASSGTADYRPAQGQPASTSTPNAAEPPESGEQARQPGGGSSAGDVDWLRNLDASAPLADQAAETTPPVREEPPDWLKKLQAEQSPSEPEPSTVQQPRAPDSEVPAWLRSFGEETLGPPEPETPAPVPPHVEQHLPDWLGGEGIAAAQDQASPQEHAEVGDLPDWISTLGQAPASSSEETKPRPASLELEKPAVEASPGTGAAFTEESISGGDMDAIFASLQMPDWLSAVAPGQASAEESLPPAAQEAVAIGPAELPSWVQAMRPVESAMAASAASQDEAGLEERGPLAGLHGVLPAVPGAAAPSSKPKSHSIKLEATELQQAHAALLEQILAAETAPVPMRTSATLKPQRALRWVISVLLFLVIGGVVFARTQTLPLPSAVPNETIGAIQAVEAVPADAAVLLVFDYQPSTVGEMEATGASLLDHLLLLKHPHLALLSTSPTGSALAERFMSTTLAQRGYARDLQYVDLGYLPGGLTGVYAFAQNPSAAVPLGADSRAVWQSGLLGPVTHYSDFASVIVLTDSVEAGRTWIEQTAAARGKGTLIIASSAQAGPMLLPYVDSGQVNGLVSGVNGAAGAEQANGGLPGYVRRYWDAYSLGLYFAVLLILAGGLWNFWLGIRDRRAQVAG